VASSFFQRLKQGLSRTHQELVGRIGEILGTRAVTPQMADDLLEVLLAGDLGVETSTHLIGALKERIRAGEVREPADVPAALKEIMLKMLLPVEGVVRPGEARPWVVMFVGVNGSGKTTTIAKLGHRWIAEGRKVSFAAADTFRAGAVEQLKIWADRVGAGFFAGKYGADPSSVVFDAVSSTVARGGDILLIDTAGRLHTSTNLMEELRKVHRTCGKVLPGSPHEVILVLDASTGQNALRQARLFHEAIGLTGIALTKLDGTAKGGIILSVARELAIPVKLVGVGEAREDLQDFHAAEFVEAVFAD
jgi:fused signal recognition particle receptor